MFDRKICLLALLALPAVEDTLQAQMPSVKRQPLNTLGRHLGIGVSSGYHSCENSQPRLDGHHLSQLQQLQPAPSVLYAQPSFAGGQRRIIHDGMMNATVHHLPQPPAVHSDLPADLLPLEQPLTRSLLAQPVPSRVPAAGESAGRVDDGGWEDELLDRPRDAESSVEPQAMPQPLEHIVPAEPLQPLEEAETAEPPAADLPIPPAPPAQQAEPSTGFDLPLPSGSPADDLLGKTDRRAPAAWPTTPAIAPRTATNGFNRYLQR